MQGIAASAFSEFRKLEKLKARESYSHSDKNDLKSLAAIQNT